MKSGDSPVLFVYIFLTNKECYVSGWKLASHHLLKERRLSFVKYVR